MEFEPGPRDGVSPLEALLELSRSASEDPLPRVLSTVAETVRRTAGFNSVVLNIFRPAWDDYEAVLVIGQEESVEALAGTAVARTTFDPLLDSPQRLPGVFFLAAESHFWESIHNTFTPELTPTDEPDAWQAEDGLLVFLSDSEGQPLAFVSVDEPVSRRRPTDDDLRLLRAICSHAEHGLENARRSERTEQNRRMLSLLLETSPALSACTATVGAFGDGGQDRRAAARLRALRRLLDRRRRPRAVRRPWLGERGSARSHARPRTARAAALARAPTRRLLSPEGP